MIDDKVIIVNEDMSLQKTVVIGGGNGSAVTINAVKQFKDDVNISAVIGMSDSGGSSGKLRKEFGVLPTGDIMRAILALSAHDASLLKKVFYRNRFTSAGKLDGHNVGNLFLVFAAQYAGSFESALLALHQAVDAVGFAYPVSTELSDLCVELSNGDIVIGEHEIDRPAFDRNHRIRRAWLQPTPPLYEPAKQVIEKADAIILGPGSLYTSIVSVLAVEGVKDAIRDSKAKLVFVAGNAYEITGETGPTILSEIVRELEAYLPRMVDLIVYNNHVLTEDSKKKYIDKQWGLFAYDPENLQGQKIIAGDYEKKGGGLCPEFLGSILKEIL